MGGHHVCLVRHGGINHDAFDTLRRNAFHSDGAVVVDGKSGLIAASGWFVSDITEGGAAGGARSRAAKAVAQQAGGCYVIKCSEDSRGQLSLHLGTRSMKFNGLLADLESAMTPDAAEHDI